MTLSIIIVNYNVKHFLHQCLKSIERSKQNIDLEIFVVDNNSVDGSINMIQNGFPHVKLISNDKNIGFAKANNQAIKKAKGKYILLLNPDTIIEENTLIETINSSRALKVSAGSQLSFPYTSMALLHSSSEM